MDDSPNSEEHGSRRQVLDEEDESGSSEKETGGVPDGEGEGEGEGEASIGRGVLSGTGLSSDSEDGDASGGERVQPSGGDDGNSRESGDEDGDDDDEDGDKPSKSAMKDLFGEDEEEEEEEEEDEADDAGRGGEVAREVGGGGGGRYGGGSSDDEDVFGEGGGIRGKAGGGVSSSSSAGGSGKYSAGGGGGGIPRGGAGDGSSDEDQRDEDEEGAPPPSLPDREMKIPVLPRPPAGADVSMSRLPNILGVKTEAFDPDNYDEEAETDEFKFTTNIIRWRHKRDNLGPEMGEDGMAVRETNTRLVKWSDGSMQMLVGDEAFDVGEHSIDRSALFVQQMTQEGSVLQCQGQLTKKIAFKPSNVLSKAHRTLTLAVRKRAVKGARIKKYAETIDPEQVKQERARADEVMYKQVRRKNNIYKKDAEGGGLGRRHNMNISFLEDGAFDRTSVRGIKDDTRSGRYDRSSDEEDSEDESRGMEELIAKRAAAAAAASQRISENDDDDGDDDDDDDDDVARGWGKGKAAAGHRGPRNDDDSSDSGDGSENDSDDGGGKRSRTTFDEEDSAQTRGPVGKRVHRSIAEESDSE